MSGPQCCDNPPTLSSSSGAGQVEEIAGLKTYVSGPSDSKLGVLLVSDIFGFEAPKLRKLADKVAAAGFYVVVPDFLHGDPYAPEIAERPLPVWIKDHGPDKGAEAAKPVIEALRSKGVSSLGAAGFCWGGELRPRGFPVFDFCKKSTPMFIGQGRRLVVELSKHPYFDAAVLLHPSFVSLDDIKAAKVPISVLGAEIDKMSPPELVKQFEEALDAKPEVDSFVKIFPSVSHGWTVRYEDKDEVAVKSAEEAHKDLIDWFAKHLK